MKRILVVSPNKSLWDFSKPLLFLLSPSCILAYTPLIDIDKKCIDQTLEGLKKVSSRNYSVSIEIATIFEKDPREFKFFFFIFILEEK